MKANSTGQELECARRLPAGPGSVPVATGFRVEFTPAAGTGSGPVRWEGTGSLSNRLASSPTRVLRGESFGFGLAGLVSGESKARRNFTRPCQTSSDSPHLAKQPRDGNFQGAGDGGGFAKQLLTDYMLKSLLVLDVVRVPNQLPQWNAESQRD